MIFDRHGIPCKQGRTWFLYSSLRSGQWTWSQRYRCCCSPSRLPDSLRWESSLKTEFWCLLLPQAAISWWNHKLTFRKVSCSPRVWPKEPCSRCLKQWRIPLSKVLSESRSWLVEVTTTHLGILAQWCWRQKWRIVSLRSSQELWAHPFEYLQWFVHHRAKHGHCSLWFGPLFKTEEVAWNWSPESSKPSSALALMCKWFGYLLDLSKF